MHNGRFILTPVKNNSAHWKMFFGEGKKGRFDHWAKIWPQRNTPTTKTRFWVHWAEIQCKLWTRWSNQKKWKESARGYNFTHMPTPHCIFGGHHILRVRSEGDVIKLENFRWIGWWVLERQVGRKWPSSIDLTHRATLWWSLLESS